MVGHHNKSINLKCYTVERLLKSIKVVCACHGDNLRTHWWKAALREVVKLKKEAFWAWLSQGSNEAADSYQVAKKAAAFMVAEVKTQVWEEFGETMEKDFHLASRVFWHTTQKGEAGAFPGGAVPGWRPADPN